MERMKAKSLAAWYVFFDSFAMDGSRCAQCKIQLATSLESTEWSRRDSHE
jgi:hypothetical protein